MNKLREAQTKALKEFEEHYYNKENDKGILSACCAFGKTRLCYEIIKKCNELKGETKFIIVTSRVKLVNSTMKEMKKWFETEKKQVKLFLIGGSGEEYPDDTLKKANIKSSFVYNAVTKNTMTILISTYDSSINILDELTNDVNAYPDLIIFDESHNTTGDKTKYHQKLMDLDSEKKLFMTATPLKLLFKNKDNIANEYIDEVIYTMNNKDKYGEIFYEYEFVDGIKDKIICDFRTITLGKKGEFDLEEYKKKTKGKTKQEKQDIYFHVIGSQLATCIKTYELKHILVYLSDQTKLKRFKEILGKIKEKNHDIKYEVESIISGDSKSKRTKAEDNFQNVVSKDGKIIKQKVDVPKILLSVGIYNEGVDIPCIDSVLFAQERTSATTIVQNIGRALRQYNKQTGGYYDKEMAYVILPTLLYKLNDTDSSSIYSSQFKELRKMIKILNGKNENHFYDKYIKSKDKIMVGNDLGDLSDEDDFDETTTTDKNPLDKSNTKANEIIQNIDIDDIIDLYKGYEPIMGDKKIANIQLKDVLEIIKKDKIDSIQKWGKYCNENKSPHTHLHKEFKREWKTWSHIFNGVTFTYDEAKEFIKTKLCLEVLEMEESKDWFKFIENTINNELEGGDTFIYIDDLIKIPNQPKDYYKEKWISWSDFLGKYIDTPIVNKEGNPTYEKNADRNLRYILNNDNYKANVNIEWTDYIIKTDLSKIHNYIGNKFKNDFNLVTQIKYKPSGKYDNVRIVIQDKNNKIIGYIYPSSKGEMSYDGDILMKEIWNKKDIPVCNKRELLPEIYENIMNDIQIEVKNTKNADNTNNANNTIPEQNNTNNKIDKIRPKVIVKAINKQKPVRPILKQLDDSDESFRL